MVTSRYLRRRSTVFFEILEIWRSSESFRLCDFGDLGDLLFRDFGDLGDLLFCDLGDLGVLLNLFFSRTFSRASWKIEEFESACEIREISATLSSARNEPNRKKTPIRNWRNFRHTNRKEYYTIIFIFFGSNHNACLRWGFSLHLYFSWYGMPRVAFCTTYTWAMPSEAWQLVWLSLSSTFTYLTRDPSTRKKTKCLLSHFLGF